MAEIHVFGWRCAYKEFISMEFLFNNSPYAGLPKSPF
jgi:hypothetical protein